MTGMATATPPVVEPIDPAVIDPASAAIASEAATDANPAAPSTVDSQDANAPTSLLDVVKAAVAPVVEPVASSDPQGDPVVVPPVAGEALAEPEAVDDANLPFHNHPRWKEVIAERDTLREPAENFGKITAFMHEHGLTPVEIAEGYEVMALLKSKDPAQLGKAREWFSDRLDSLDGMLGHTLPTDLQQRVDEGLLDPEGASELARSRASASLRETQETERAATETQAASARELQAASAAMVTAVEGWEARTKASDPDYSKKADLVLAKCQAIVAQTGQPPRTAAEATALTDRALSEVNAILKAALPKPRAIIPAPAGQSTPAVVAPTTLRGAIDAALGR